MKPCDIKNKHRRLYKVIELLAKLDHNSFNDLTDLQGQFPFGGTAYSYQFWVYVDSENWEQAKYCYPRLFEDSFLEGDSIVKLTKTVTSSFRQFGIYTQKCDSSILRTIKNDGRCTATSSDVFFNYLDTWCFNLLPGTFDEQTIKKFSETSSEITFSNASNISYLGDAHTNSWKYSPHLIMGTDPYLNNSISLSGGSQDNYEKPSKYVHLEHKDVEMEIPDFPKKNKKRNN